MTGDTPDLIATLTGIAARARRDRERIGKGELPSGSTALRSIEEEARDALVRCGNPAPVDRRSDG